MNKSLKDYTSDDERHENEYTNEMNTWMKLNAALMEMKAQLNV